MSTIAGWYCFFIRTFFSFYWFQEYAISDKGIYLSILLYFLLCILISDSVLTEYAFLLSPQQKSNNLLSKKEAKNCGSVESQNITFVQLSITSFNWSHLLIHSMEYFLTTILYFPYDKSPHYTLKLNNLQMAPRYDDISCCWK